MSVSTVVCFDLGGVLVRICRGWEEACTRAGLPYWDSERLSSEAARARRRDVLDRYQSGLVETAAFYDELSDALFGVYSAKEAERIFEAWTLEEYAGAQELVARLNELPHVKTACLSNTNDAHWQRLVNLDGRREYPAVAALEHQLASHVLQCLKPEPQIYAHASDAFSQGGVEPPERVFFFDDLPENVEAACAHGWDALRIDPERDTVGQVREHLARAGLVV